VTETIYGVFAARPLLSETQTITKLMNNTVFFDLDDANRFVGELKLRYASNFEVHIIECEVK
jgi:hypothetical protein